jgi:hypothetical protein
MSIFNRDILMFNVLSFRIHADMEEVSMIMGSFGVYKAIAIIGGCITVFIYSASA